MISIEQIRKAAILGNKHNARGSAGYFACVTPHSPGYVKKASPGDWAYRDFIERVADGTFQSEHLPAIKRLHVDGTGCLVIMERLVHVQDLVEDPWAVRRTLDRLTEAFEDIGDPNNEDDIQAFCESLAQEGAEEMFFEPELVKLCWHIGEMASDEGMHFDLHANNVMFRESDGKVIVTDPVCDLNDGIPLEHIEWEEEHGTGGIWGSDCSDCHSDSCECDMCCEMRDCELDLGV